MIRYQIRGSWSIQTSPSDFRDFLDVAASDLFRVPLGGVDEIQTGAMMMIKYRENNLTFTTSIRNVKKIQ
jgi:hypothetical protein